MEKVFRLTESEIFAIVRRTTLAVVSDLRQDLQKAGDREVMSKSQVAEYLGRSVATIDRWMANEGLPFEKVDKHAHPTFYKSDIDLWLKSRKNASPQAI